MMMMIQFGPRRQRRSIDLRPLGFRVGGCVCGSKSGQSSKMGLSLSVPQQPSMTIIMIKLFLDLVNKTKAPRPRSVGGCVCSLFSALSTPA